MVTLIDKVPSAIIFCNHVYKNIEKYKLFEEETFGDIIFGVLSTTEVDTHGDKMPKEVLDSIEKNIKDGYILWERVEHNPLIQPIGRLISAKVFQIPESKEYFLVGVSGKYDIKNIPSFNDLGINLKANMQKHEDYNYDIKFDIPNVFLSINLNNFDEKIINNIMNSRPKNVGGEPLHEFRKAVDPIEIVKLIVAFHILIQNPFSKKFLETFGEETALSFINIIKWIKNKVILLVKESRKKKRTLLEFSSDYKNCLMEFVVDDNEDFAIHYKAIDTISIAARSAKILIDQIEFFEPTNIIYEFDVNIEKWIPIHAATKRKGIISDKVQLISYEKYKGFSLSGITKENKNK